MDYIDCSNLLATLKIYNSRDNFRFTFLLKLPFKYLKQLGKIGDDLISTIYNDLGENYLFESKDYIIFVYNKGSCQDLGFSEKLICILDQLFCALNVFHLSSEYVQCNLYSDFSSLGKPELQEAYLKVIKRSGNGKLYVNFDLHFPNAVVANYINTLVDSGADLVTLPGKSISNLCKGFAIYSTRRSFEDYLLYQATVLEGKDSELARVCKKYITNTRAFLLDCTEKERLMLINRLNIECLGGFSDGMLTTGHKVVLPEIRAYNDIADITVVFQNVSTYIIPGDTKSILGMSILSKFITTINTEVNWVSIKPCGHWDEVEGRTYYIDFKKDFNSKNQDLLGYGIDSFSNTEELIPLLSNADNLKMFLNSYYNSDDSDSCY